MRWYLALYDEAGDAMYPTLRLTAVYFAASGTGGLDLEHHLWYPVEVCIRDTVVIRTRILARRLKLFHRLRQFRGPWGLKQPATSEEIRLSAA